MPFSNTKRFLSFKKLGRIIFRHLKANSGFETAEKLKKNCYLTIFAFF